MRIVAILWAVWVSVAFAPFVSAEQMVHREAYDKNYIHIVYALDKNLLPPTVVSVASIVEVSADPSMLFFHFVTVKLPAQSVTALISACVPGSFRHDAVEWTEIPEVIRTMKIRHPSRQDLAAAPNYVRFYVGVLYPNIDRFIYIDTDTFVTRDIKQLWDVYLGDNVMGLRDICSGEFAQEMFQRHYNNSKPEVYHIMHSNHSNCFPNAGVMIVNQRRFNELNILEKVENLMVRNRKGFIYNLGSQPLITLTCWDHYVPIPSTWNYSGREGRVADCCALYHYTGHPKPWEPAVSSTNITRMKLWRQVAKTTEGHCLAANASSFQKFFHNALS